MKIAIITSIFGAQQPLHTPNNLFPTADYFAFVDRYHKCQGWNQILSQSFSLDPQYRGRRDAKIYKIAPQIFLPDYDYWIWTDPTHEAIIDPVEICELLNDKEIGVFKHTERACVYDEAEELLKLNLDYPQVIKDQMAFYEREGYPKDNNLYELPVFVRKNTERIRTLNLMWWELICRFSSRDQISLPFVLWKYDIEPFIYEGLANGGLLKNAYLPQVRWKNH